ncbi:hypothetical protein lerEdw1_011739 [Lerista edwardsae]|nr:hypothetical protein lerEdw1_011739 [Lerista edwardsae]
MIGASVKGHNLPCEDQPITSRIAVICGTSSCHMGINMVHQLKDCLEESVYRNPTTFPV